MRGLSLEELGEQIKRVDMHLVALLARRMSLSSEVERVKNADPNNRIKLYNKGREDKRLSDVRRWAKKKRLNPDFARSILYEIIGESCKVQMIQVETPRQEAKVDGDPAALKQNLLTLTGKIAASYDKLYSRGRSATRLYQAFEMRILKRMIRSVPKIGLVVDLGCATGRISLALRGRFSQVIGYDLSPEMVAVAEGKVAATDSVRFEVADLEQGIPLTSDSVSLVVMSLGTASDFPDIWAILTEARRVLRPEGKLLLSFYNREAMFYTEYLPWEESLAAEMNLKKNWLEVHYESELFPIFARAYSRNEVKDILGSLGFEIQRVLTHPTISALLPEELLESDRMVKQIIQADESLAHEGFGAYIIAVARKS